MKAEHVVEEEPARRWLRPREVLRRYGFTSGVLRAAEKKGKLHASRPSARVTLWKVGEIEQLLEDATQNPRRA